ncbi:MAG: carboxypeptidase-like regulatory domain-containing protein [Saprospiraceae bacterium]|nr:carboxypeptidase-like regulatory domain-containing protein [Saprospiraceae bacterium]
MKKLYTDVGEIWQSRFSSSPVYTDQRKFSLIRLCLRRVYLALSLMLWLSVLHAQQPIGLIFRISAEEAKELYKHGDKPIPDSYFHTVVDSFGIDRYVPEAAQRNGHYLYVRANREELEIFLNSTHTHHVLSVNNDRDLMLRVLNEEGTAIEDAQLKLGSKTIPYDPSVGSYRIKKRNRGGFLAVYLPTDTLFYEIDPKDSKGLLSKRYRHFTETQFGYYLTSPIRWGGQIYHYLRRLVLYGSWRPPRKYRRNGARSLHGYMLTHKPKYEPGDTVRLKAYATSPKGKPINRSLRITAKRYRQASTILDTLVEPITSGAFLLDWAIPDTVKLDQDYTITVTHPRHRKWDGLIHNFQYEAYQLDEVNYELQLPQDTFQRGERFVLTASAKDQNDLPVYDASIKLHVIVNRLLSFHADEIIIPDTLWAYEGSVVEAGKVDIVIPDSIFPAVRMRAQIAAVFSNSNGELQEKKRYFHYSPLDEQIQIDLRHGQLHGTYFRNQQEDSTAAILISTSVMDELPDSIQIQLPLSLDLSPLVKSYKIVTATAAKEIRLKSNYSSTLAGINFQVRREQDSIYLSLQNPHKISVNWLLQYPGGTLAEGTTMDEVWKGKWLATKNKSYYLKYQYQWGGQVTKKEQEVIQYKKLLKIEVDQPNQIAPGQEAVIQVKVKDHKGLPAEGVNLAVGAVNAQFETHQHLSPAKIPYKKGIEPMVYNSFKLRASSWSDEKVIGKKWRDDLQLANSHYYRLRYPKEGVYFQVDTLQQDSFYQTVAQFAPFIVKNGKSLPIYMIYCNRRLVYYDDIDRAQPYSFQGIEGLNSIIIRTRDAEISIDSVRLQKGEKLEFSIDLLHYMKWEHAKRIRIKEMPSVLTQEEKRLIRNSILVLKRPTGGSITVWDEANNIQHYDLRYNYQQHIKLGPFLQNSTIHYQESNGFKTDFPFEPGFSYDLSSEQIKLYQHDIFSKKEKVHLSNRYSGKPYQKVIYSPNEILTPKPILEPKRLKTTEEAQGAYFYDYHSKDWTIFGSVLQQEDSIIATYVPTKRRFLGIPEGTYNLTIIRSDFQLYQTQIHIQANRTFYQRLSDLAFKPDTTSWLSAVTAISYSSYPTKVKPPVDPSPWPYSGHAGTITGYIRDSSGEPLIGAAILVKGTTRGTVTDIDGRFEIQVSQSHPTFVVSYTGFGTQEFSPQGPEVDLNLSEAPEYLEELIVTGYSSSRAFGDPVIQTDAISIQSSRAKETTYWIDGVRTVGTSPTLDLGLVVRGNSSAQVDSPLYIIDGKIGDPSKLLPNQIRTTSVIKGPEAVAIYGSRGANGIIVISTNLGPAGLDLFALTKASGLRTDFKDYGYWKPNIITDKNGEASFTVRFPDNVTAWKGYALGMDKKRRSGVGFAETRAFKPITAQLAVPRFLIEGDQAAIIGKSSNYTPDSLQIKTRFLASDSLLSQQESWLSNGKVESTDIHAGMAGDTLAITYSLSAMNGAYEDGERRKIPVLKKGTLETQGTFHLLDQDTSLELSFTEEMGQVELYMERDLLPQLIREIDYLKNYKYGCNEQTASKLIALCLEKSVREQLGESFDDEALIQKCIRRLDRNQNEAGGWGWWEKAESVNWITRHVIKALLMADKLGYSSQRLEIALRDLTRDAKVWSEQEILANISILAQAKQNFSYAETLAVLDTQSNSLLQQFQILRIKQLSGLPYQLDSLYHYQKTTLFGSHYWGEPSYGFPGNDIRLTLLAHDILVEAGKKEEAQKVKTFFVENRRHTGQRHNWRNTLETAMILRSILPGILAEGKKVRERIQVQLAGATTNTIDSFPYRLEQSEFSENLTIKKTGSGRLYLTAYQTFWNDTPTKTDSTFAVSTSLEQEGVNVQQLEKGKKAELVIKVESKKRAGYLMLEVPIPASCSYASKPNGRRGVEVHREYDIHQTSIFIEDLPPGKHEFRISLEPRYSGAFTLNPAKMEQMYFPTFYGREGMKEVEVKEK